MILSKTRAIANIPRLGTQWGTLDRTKTTFRYQLKITKNTPLIWSLPPINLSCVSNRVPHSSMHTKMKRKKDLARQVADKVLARLKDDIS
jgi:hypothetical protein